MFCNHIKKGIIVSGAAALLIIISVGIIGTIVMINITGTPHLIIQLSEQSLRVPSSGGGIVYRSINGYAGQKDYVVMMQVIGYTPTGYTINSTVMLSKGFQSYTNSIDLREFIKAWEHYYKKHSPFTFYRMKRDLPIPSITAFLITYLPDGKILVGADEIDSYTALIMMGYPPWKARKIILNDPLYPFRHPLQWKLNMTLIPINIDKIVTNITRSVEKITGQKLGVPGMPHPTSYQGVETQVWFKQLYNARNNPPSTWYNRIRDSSGSPAPRFVVDDAWYAFATRFSQEYIFDKGSWSLQDALKYVFFGIGNHLNYGKPAILLTMTTLLHLLCSETSQYHWEADSIDETINVPILYIASTYNVQRQYIKDITFLGQIIKDNYSDRYMGISLFGFILESNNKFSLSSSLSVLQIDASVPSGAIIAPLHLSNTGTNRPDELVIVLADVTSNNNNWIIKPLVMIMPYLTTISIDYRKAKAIYCSNGAPENYDKIVWSSYMDTVYDNLVTKNSGKPFLILNFNSSDASLRTYSGSIIGYYFPLIGKVLNVIGFVSQVADTIGDLIGIAEATAATDPLVAVALFMANLIGNCINIALYQANGSILHFVIIGENHVFGNEEIPVTVKVRYGFATKLPAYKPLFVEVDVTVGYTNAPPNAESI